MSYHNLVGIGAVETSDAHPLWNRGCLPGMPTPDEQFVLAKIDALPAQRYAEYQRCAREYGGTPGESSCRASVEMGLASLDRTWRERLERLCPEKSRAVGCGGRRPNTVEEVALAREIKGWDTILDWLLADCGTNSGCKSGVRNSIGYASTRVRKQFADLCATLVTPAPAPTPLPVPSPDPQPQLVPAVVAPTPTAPFPSAAVSNPFAAYRDGCGRAGGATAEERAIVAEADAVYRDYGSRYNACLARFQPQINAELVPGGNAELVRSLVASRNACLSTATSSTIPRLQQLVSAMQAECARGLAPEPESTPVPVRTIHAEPDPVYTEAEPAPVFEEATPVYDEPEPVYDEPEPVYDEPEPPDGNRNLVIGGILLVLVAGGALYWGLRRKA